MYDFKKLRRSNNTHCFSHKNFDLSQPEKMKKIRRKTCRYFNVSESENESEVEKKVDLIARKASMKESFKLIKIQNENLLKTNKDIVSKLSDFQKERSLGLKKSILLMYSICDKKSIRQKSLENQFNIMADNEFSSFREFVNKRNICNEDIQELFSNRNDNLDYNEQNNNLFSVLANCLPKNLVNDINFGDFSNNMLNQAVINDDGFRIVKSPAKSIRSFSSLSNFKSLINMSIFNTSLNKEKLAKESASLKSSKKDSLSGFNFSDMNSQFEQSDVDSIQIPFIADRNLPKNNKYGI